MNITFSLCVSRYPLLFLFISFYSEFTAENLRFLNIDQALADLAYFIVEIKKQSRFADSKVILYGGSYAANMVMWFKKRYPHLVVGTVASSGPILAKVDYTGMHFYIFLNIAENQILFHFIFEPFLLGTKRRLRLIKNASFIYLLVPRAIYKCGKRERASKLSTI